MAVPKGPERAPVARDKNRKAPDSKGLRKTGANMAAIDLVQQPISTPEEKMAQEMAAIVVARMAKKPADLAQYQPKPKRKTVLYCRDL